MSCGLTPEFARMMVQLKDENEKRESNKLSDIEKQTNNLQNTDIRIETLNEKLIEKDDLIEKDRGNWSLQYKKWELWEELENEIEKKQELEEQKVKLQKESLKAHPLGCNHDHSIEQKLMDMTFQEKMNLASEWKCIGNAYYTQGQYQRAAFHYHRALLYFEYMFPEDNTKEEKEMEELQITILLNFSTSRLKMKTQYIDQVILHTTQAMDLLKKRINVSHMIKALYRRAQAYRYKDEFDLALVDITNAIQLSTSNGKKDRALEFEKRLLLAKKHAYKVKSKQLSASMFGSHESKDSRLSQRIANTDFSKDQIYTIVSNTREKNFSSSYTLDSCLPSTDGLLELQEFIVNSDWNKATTTLTMS